MAKKHKYENDPPCQEKFEQERGGVKTFSTAKPLDSQGNNGGDFGVPQRRHAYGEFLSESHTKGIKTEAEE